MRELPVEVWVVPAVAGLATEMPQLDPVERERSVAMAGAQLAGFVVSRGLLRRVVAQRRGCAAGEVELVARCPACGGGHGPLVVRVAGGAGPHVSLTRSSGLVAVAVSDAAGVGVDVERRRAVRPVVARVALTPAEREAFAALPGWRRRGALARAWVRKEAVLKVLGTGLRTDPATVDCGSAGRAGRFAARLGGELVAVGDDLLLGGGWVGAVALAAGTWGEAGSAGEAGTTGPAVEGVAGLRMWGPIRPRDGAALLRL